MPAAIAKTIECPVCGQQHPAWRGLPGVDTIACDKVTPTGSARFYPGFFVMVLGAGVGVDAMPPRVETAGDKAARLSAIEAELRKAEEEAGHAKKLNDLDARVAEAEAKLASVKAGGPAPVAEPAPAAEPVTAGGKKAKEAP